VVSVVVVCVVVVSVVVVLDVVVVVLDVVVVVLDVVVVVLDVVVVLPREQTSSKTTPTAYCWQAALVMQTQPVGHGVSVSQ
jgi:hypothetical protein